ncbi:MAG: serine hydrolase domain-containing protein [Pseudomonadota bacterium]
MPTTRPKPVGRPAVRPKFDITGKLKDFRAKHLVPGMSVAVSYRGEIIKAQSLGYRKGSEKNRVFHKSSEWKAADNDTTYRLASVSKTVTAVLAMRLAGRGKLDLDASVHDYIDDYPVTKGRLTPRMLLGHTSGIRHYKGRSNAGRYNKQAWDTCTDVAALLHDTAFGRNRDYLYSTHAYTILGACLEGASGMDFPRLLFEELKPAGRNLISCEGGSVAGKPTRLSQLWAHRSGKRRRAKHVSDKYKIVGRDRLNWKWPGGGMLSTASKLALFGAAVCDGTLMSDRWQDEMWSTQRLWNGNTARSDYGLGWSLGTRGGLRIVAHRGFQTGASSYLRMMPDQQIVVSILCNTRDLPVVNLGRSIMADAVDFVRPRTRGRTTTRKGK